MITFEPLKIRDLLDLNMPGQRERIEGIIAGPEVFIEQLERFAMTAFIDGQVVGCAGIQQGDAHVGECWMGFEREFTLREWGLILRETREMIERGHRAGMVRLWASVKAGFYTGERFLSKLGFTCEGPMRHYDFMGNTHYLYAKIDARSPDDGT